ncbi:unnamed protein product [Schistosoma bovis]|nr:unnamed protein product [Schistosoma bovis]
MLISMVITLLSYIHISEGLFQCKKLGETCHKTVFDRCCGNTVCQLKGFKGKCVRCLSAGSRCIKNRECCHVLFKCKRLGDSCRRTIFHRCCGDATCQLNSSKGKCVPLLRVDRSCWRNKDCCSGRCHRSKCKNFENRNINAILQKRF